MPDNGFARLTPAPLKQVTIHGGFWGQRIDVNRTATLPIEYRQCKDTGRIDAWKLAWRKGDPRPPHIFWDSDVAKWIEAAAYSLATHPDPALEAQVDEVVDLMAKAQQPDGYLNTHFIAVEPEKRWTNLRDAHEMYCAGHLIEAAVAYQQATGKTQMLEVLARYADHIARTFGRGDGQKRGYCGHEEVELALVKLYRATGQKRYLELAKYFIDERGAQPHYYDQEARARGDDPAKHWTRGYAYYQAHKPVREQTAADGHAVRAMYLYCGMTDVAAETHDPTLLPPLNALWENVTGRRMYVTGGVGSSAHGEAFTTDFDLPNASAYAETCAAIGLVFWAHRMLNLEADGRYADVLERALYNGTISGVSLDGRRFFYVNPLESCGQHHRQDWFDCACCPPNIARLLASLGTYAYSTGPGEVYVHLYAGGEAKLDVAGTRVQLVQTTAYPWQEKVELAVGPVEPAKFALALRIPAWCSGATLKVNGTPQDLGPILRRGYARVERLWQKGDTIELTLPMSVQRLEARPEVAVNAGRVAVQRGPVVYCLEQADNGPHLNDLVLPRDAPLTARFEPDLLGGVVMLTGTGRRRTGNWDAALYRPVASRQEPAPLKFVPYFAWDNRQAGEMLVWVRDG